MICPDCGADFSEGKPTPGAALGLHRYREHGHRSEAKPKSPARRRRATPQRAAPQRAAPTPEPEPVSVLFDPTEAEPVVPKRKKFWSDWFAREPTAPGEIRPSKPGRPRKSHRTSFAGGGTVAWMGLSQMAKPISLPVSRTLQIQAGVAVEVIDKAVEGTRLDKMVQPFIGDTERFRDFGMLVAFPLLVAVCDAQKENVAAAALLEMVVRQQLHTLAEGVRRMKAEDRRLADTVETLTGIGMDLGENPVHAILSMIFAPVEQAPSGPAPVPGAVPESSPPAPPPVEKEWVMPPEANGQAPAVEPLPFGAVILTPADVPPGL